MTAKTPVRQLEYLVPGEPVYLYRQVFQKLCEDLEAQLNATALAPPGAADVTALQARLNLLETPPGRRVGKSGTNNAVNAWGLLTWDTHPDGGASDPAGAGMFSATTPGRLIAPPGRPGRYRASGMVTFSSTATAGDKRLQLRKNSAGSPTAGTMLTAAAAAGVTAGVSLNFSTDEFRLAAGEHVELYGLSTVTTVMGTTAGYEASFTLSYVGK